MGISLVCLYVSVLLLIFSYDHENDHIMPMFRLFREENQLRRLVDPSESSAGSIIHLQL